MNKHAIAAVAALCSFAASATPSENTFAAVTNDWYNANFTNVYELAQQRLAANSNDVVGAYLMLGWDVSFSDIASMSNSTARLLACADAVSCSAFSDVYSQMRPAYVIFKDEFLPTQSDANRHEEQRKEQRPGRRIPEIGMLELLWKSGLW